MFVTTANRQKAPSGYGPAARCAPVGACVAGVPVAARPFQPHPSRLVKRHWKRGFLAVDGGSALTARGFWRCCHRSLPVFSDSL